MQQVLSTVKYPNFVNRFDFSLTQIIPEGMESGGGHASAGNIPLAGMLEFLAWMFWAIILIF